MTAGEKELAAFHRRLTRLSRTLGAADVIYRSGGWPVHRVTFNPRGARTLAVVAGVHGDEAGGPYGAMGFLEHVRDLPPGIRVDLVPLANPVGFSRRTRGRGDGLDINRGFYDPDPPAECRGLWGFLESVPRLDLLLTLHEDVDVGGFYVYQGSDREAALAEGLRGVGRRYFPPLESPTGELYGDPIAEGLVPPPHLHRKTFEDRCRDELGVAYVTTETPGLRPLADRARCNRDFARFAAFALAAELD